jgi:tRNA splicing endonuclease
MEYKKKVAIASRGAEQLQGQKNAKVIEADLKTEGLYEKDILAVMISARNILGEKYQSSIRAHLLGNKDLKSTKEFNSLDAEILEKISNNEIEKFALEEKNKIFNLVKKNTPLNQILEQVDKRFLPLEKAQHHAKIYDIVKYNNSGESRTYKILGGVGCIIITGILFASTGRLYYVLPIIGLILIVKGFTTEVIKIDE